MSEHGNPGSTCETKRFPAIYFEATRRCNLRCPMCMTGSNDSERVRSSRRRELSYDEIRDRVLVPARRLGTVAVGGKLTVSVGINSLDDTNEWSRDAEGNRTLEVLETCRELGIDRHVIITIGKHNTDSFERTVDYLVERRISYNRSPLVARGSGTGHFEAVAFDREDLREAFHPVLRRNVNGYVSYTPFFLSPELYEEASGTSIDGQLPQKPPVGC